MKKILFINILLIVSGFLVFSQVTLKDDFGAGTPILASDMNTNFGTIETNLNSLWAKAYWNAATGGILSSEKLGVGTMPGGGVEAMLHLGMPSDAVEGDPFMIFRAAQGRTMQLLQPEPGKEQSPFTWWTVNAIKWRLDATDRMILDDAGQLGIGTMEPEHLLDIHTDTGDCPVRIEAAEGGSANAYIDLESGDDGYKLFCYEDSGTSTHMFGIFSYEVGGSGRTRFRINNGIDVMCLMEAGGSVSVGTGAMPTQTLHVAGNAYKTEGGTAWATSSDLRLKTVHGEFKRGVEALAEIQPVDFSYLDNETLGLSSDKHQIGLIAQEVQEVIPEAVMEDSTGYLSIKADPIFWTMLNAIKQQQTQIEELKSRLEELEGM